MPCRSINSQAEDGVEVSGLKNWIARSSIISIAAVVEVASRFGRTAILSRLLTPSEFGTSVAITVVMSTAGLITDVAFDKFVMVRPDEDRALAAAHMLSIFRGGLVALTMILSASSIAAFFGVSQYSPSFALVAIAPLIRSFGHLGVAQAQREHNYVPSTLTQLFAQVAALAAVLSAAYMLRDHRAIVAGFLIESFTYCIASHILAPKAYRLQSDREVFAAALSFGIPLLVNGIGLAVFSQLDRILVGHWFDVATLATYAVILNMVIVPIALINRVFGTLGLAHISARMRDQSAVRGDYLALVYLWGVMAATYALFLATTLDVLTPLIFGHYFNVSPIVQVLVIVMGFCQVAKGAPTTLLIASGKTTKLSLLTLSGGVGIVFAGLLVQWWPRFEIVLLCVVFGDVLSFGLFLLATSRWLGSQRAAVFIDTATAVGALIVILVTFSLEPEFTIGARSMVLGAGLFAVMVQSAFGLRPHKMIKNLFFHAPR
jgi:O-antigen/teichoic acid export membrane protein